MQQLTADEIPELLARLVDKSLVHVDANGHYDLLQLVRSFAQEELMRTSDNETARTRHLDYYYLYCLDKGQGIFGPDQAKSIASLVDEVDNIRVAIEWAIAVPSTWRLAPRMIEELFFFMHSQGTYEGGAALTNAAIAAVPPHADYDLALALAWQGVFQQFRGDPAAEETCNRAIQLSEQTNNLHALGRALFQRANIAWHEKRLEEGDAFAERALKLAMEAKRDRLVGAILTTLGNSALMAGRLEQALDYYRKCEQVYGSMGHTRGLTVVKGNLGHVHERMGDYEVEYRLSRDAVATFYELGDKRNLAGSIAGCASGFWLAEDFETAAILLGGAEALWERVETYADNLDADTAGRWRARLIDRIGVAAFDEAFERGKSMPLDDVVNIVLSNPEPWRR